MSDRTTAVPPDLRRLGETPSLAEYLRQMWARREFAVAVSQGELRAQHLDTALGNLWHLLNPVLLVGVYYVVFGLILGADRGVDNFIGFLAIGIFSYNFCQRAVMGGAATVVNNEGLIRSLQFPRALLPISSVLRETFAYGSALVVMVLVLVTTGEPIRLIWVVAIPALVIQIVFNVGVAFFFARVGDKIRDILNVIPYLFRIFFYLSGVLFSVDHFLPRVADRFPGWPLHEMMIANPFYVFVSLPREYLMASQTHEFVPQMWLSGLVWAVVMFVAGLLFFRAGEKEYGRG